MTEKACIMCEEIKDINKFKVVLHGVSFRYNAVCQDCCGKLSKNESKYYKITRKRLKWFEKEQNYC